VDWAFWRRKKPILVGELPYFRHPFCVEWFENQLRAHDRYVEYGSGGSTILAAKVGVPAVSMESDADFLAAVRKRLAELSLLDESRNHYIHRDIGPVGAWGCPLNPSDSRYFSAFRNYSEFPLKDADVGCCLVLVDGRFRVASALKAARSISGRSGTIVVDDYLGRKEYHVLERFLRLEDLVGVMAVFSSPPAHALSGDAFEETLREFELIPR